MPYHKPTATDIEVERVRTIFQKRYGMDVSFDDAKRLIEGVAQFIYLTHLLPVMDFAANPTEPVKAHADALHPLRPQINRKRRQAGSEH